MKTLATPSCNDADNDVRKSASGVFKTGNNVAKRVDMKHFVIKPLGVIMLMAAFGMGIAHAREASSDSSGPPYSAKERKKSAGRGGHIKFMPGSAETARERSARLTRECRGGVNAGACAGYTR